MAEKVLRTYAHCQMEHVDDILFFFAAMQTFSYTLAFFDLKPISKKGRGAVTAKEAYEYMNNTTSKL